jgi:hypothetical protein
MQIANPLRAVRRGPVRPPVTTMVIGGIGRVPPPQFRIFQRPIRTSNPDPVIM